VMALQGKGFIWCFSLGQYRVTLNPVPSSVHLHGICIRYAYVALYHCDGNDSVGGLFYICDGKAKNRKLKF
jgi:hypothetical protein